MPLIFKEFWKVLQKNWDLNWNVKFADFPCPFNSRLHNSLTFNFSYPAVKSSLADKEKDYSILANENSSLLRKFIVELEKKSLEEEMTTKTLHDLTLTVSEGNFWIYSVKISVKFIGFNTQTF